MIEGSCHCGAVRLTLPEAPEDLGSCNCSMCGRAGTLLTFVPAQQFTLRSGEGALTEAYARWAQLDSQ